MSKYIVENYVFDKTAKTITMPSIPNLKIEGVLLITNLTTGTVIYQFNKAGFGGTVNQNVLTLTFNTAAMADTDRLQIIYEPPGGVFSRLVMLGEKLVELVRAPSFMHRLPSGDMIRVLADTNSNMNSVNVVGTVSNITTLNNLNSIDSRQVVWENWNIAYQTGIRSRII